MTAVTTLPFRPGGWTVDDLDELPDDGYRYELLDGSLLVSPPPELAHQVVATRLAVLLAAQLPDDLVAVAAPGVYYDARNYRIPDLVVFPRVVLSQERPRLTPTDVLLAVEVASPGSARTDRVLKPAEYAAAGVPHFWRVEPAEGVLVVHALVGDVYAEVARPHRDVVLEQPVPLRFSLADLLP